MPTARPRYQITETDEVARAIDAAAAKWPGEPRSRLLVRVIAAGGDVLSADSQRAQRRAALERLRGRYSDVYPPGYLEDLRADWRE